MGRDLMRQLYAGSEYDFIAQRGFGKDRMAYRGDIYTFGFRHTGGFMQFKSVEKPEAPANTGERGS